MFWSPLSDVMPYCSTKLDLCLIIDSSGSIRDNNPPGGSPDNWELELEFIANLAAGFSVRQDDTRVAALVFSEEVGLVFPLNRFNSISEVQEAIRNIPYLGQTTNTPEALHQASIQCFNADNGDRDDVENVIIIVTDGVPFPAERRTPALSEAWRLKDKGTRIYTIGITDVVDEEFLSGISSGNNYFPVRNFQELEGLEEIISEQICEMAESGKYSVRHC